MDKSELLIGIPPKGGAEANDLGQYWLTDHAHDLYDHGFTNLILNYYNLVLFFLIVCNNLF